MTPSRLIGSPSCLIWVPQAWDGSLQGRTQDFPQEGAIFPGDQGTPTKNQKLTGFSPYFLGGAQILENNKKTKCRVWGPGKASKTHSRPEGALSGLNGHLSYLVGPSQA